MTVCCYLLLEAVKVDPIDSVEWLLDFSCVSVEVVADDRAEVDFQRSKRIHSVKYCLRCFNCCRMPYLLPNKYANTEKVNIYVI